MHGVNHVLFKNEKGMTLVETIIVLALISLILVAAFSIFVFGNSTFRGGTNQRDLQADVRFAVETLTHDVRYATELKILTPSAGAILSLKTKDGDGIFLNVNPYETYIFFDSISMTLTKLQRESMETVPFTTDAETPLSFALNGFPARMLMYQVQGVNSTDDKNFQIAAEVLMMNILAEDGTSKASGSSSGSAILYMTPEDSIAEMQFPETQLAKINNDQTVEISFNKNIKFSDSDGIFVTPGSKTFPLTLINIDYDLPDPILGTTLLTFNFVKNGSKPTSFVDGDMIDLRLAFGSAWEYEAFYTLTYMGGSTKKWVIE